jgi:hypothetical protein
MLLAAQFFTALIFIIINFLILLVVKTRTTTVTALIIAHLVATLFFSLSIASNDGFREIVLSLIIYSMVILFLISNYDFTSLASSQLFKFERRIHQISFYFFAAISVLLIFLALFSVIKNLAPLSQIVTDKKILTQGEIALDPMMSPSHPSHVAIKKFYLGRNLDAKKIDSSTVEFEINERKAARLKDELLTNFLLKRSSDMILIIVAISCVLLLLSQKKNQLKNESV